MDKEVLREDHGHRKQSPELFNWKETVAGVAGHPFDTVKVRLQTTTMYSGMMDAFRTIIKEEGVLGVYRGVQSPLLGLSAMNAVLFTSYAIAKGIVAEDTTKDLTVGQYFQAGALVGSAVALVEGPVDLFKCQLQRPNTPYTGFLNCASSIVKTYGIRGPTQGMVAAQMRNIPANAFYFGLYEWARTQMMPEGGDRTKLPSSYALVAGGLAGVGYWLGTYPIDMVKTTVQSDDPANRRYRGVVDATRDIYKRHGVKGFFRGFTPCMARSIPANAATFWAYEMVRGALGRDDGVEE